jgi:hypothetical protein
MILSTNFIIISGEKINVSSGQPSEEDPISIEIIKPTKTPIFKNFLYFKNRAIFPFFKPIIIGPIDIVVEVIRNAPQNEVNVTSIAFFIDNELRANKSMPLWPDIYSFNYNYWREIGKINIKATAYLDNGNTVSDELEGFIFNLGGNNTEIEESHGMLYYCDAGQYGGGFESVAHYYANLEINNNGKGKLVLEPLVINGIFNKIFKLKYKVRLVNKTIDSMHLIINRYNVILKKVKKESLKNFYFDHYIATYGPSLSEDNLIGQIDPFLFGISDTNCVDLRFPDLY